MSRYVEKEIDRQIVRVLLEIVLKTDKLHTITYGDLADEVERIFGAPRPFPTTLRWPLGRMQRACADCELSPLRWWLAEAKAETCLAMGIKNCLQ